MLLVGMSRVVEQTKFFPVVHVVDIRGIHFSQSLFCIYGYVDNSGYQGLADIVNSGKHVQSEWIALVSDVGILFAVLRKKDELVIDTSFRSVFHPKMCGTKSSPGHSDI